MKWIIIITMIFEMFATSGKVLSNNNVTDKLNSTTEIIVNTETIERVPTATMLSEFVTLNQKPELPTGCEITALTQTLNYYGYNVSKTYMADNYLTTAPIGTSDFNNAFMGNPYTKWSYGCYAPVIERDANRFFKDNGNKHTAVNITGCSVEQLYQYLDEGIPVIVWITICMLEPYESYVWNLGNEPVYFMSQEHCSTLVGYDKEKNTVSIADVYKGYVVEYSMSLFELRFSQMGRMAIVIR